MNELEIIENKITREKLLDRIEILDKVKKLTMLGNTEYMTTELVAEYYCVSIDAIKSLVNRNQEELLNNGYKLVSGKDLKEILVSFNMQFTNKKGYFECEGNKFANRSNGLFNKRSILNVGMLLTESKVAEQVRTLLLDNHEQLNNIHEKLENGEEINQEDIDKTSITYYIDKETELRNKE